MSTNSEHIHPSKLVLGHYDCSLKVVSPVEEELRIKSDMKVPAGTLLHKISDASKETKVNAERKDFEDKKMASEVTSDKALFFKSSEKPAIPRALEKKLNLEISKILKNKGFIFSPEQRQAIFDAIEQNKSLVKIRRTRESFPYIPKPRTTTKEKPLTELEKRLDLDFSVIVDDRKEAIALFKGKTFIVGSGGFSRVKFGQRLSDGKWVAVKIQKMDFKQLKEMEDNVIELLKTPELSRSDGQKEMIRILIYKIENVYNRRILRKTESELSEELQLQIGKAKRITGDQQAEKNYSIQVLLEGNDLIYYLSNPKLYLNNQSERMAISLLALQNLKVYHDKNIIHGDIKPDNMIYHQDDKNHMPISVSLIDLGMSRKLPKDQLMYTAVRPYGTRGYKAPEILSSCCFSKASDIYAMGQVFKILHSLSASDSTMSTDLKQFIDDMVNPDLKVRAELTVDLLIERMKKIIHDYNQPKSILTSKP